MENFLKLPKDQLRFFKLTQAQGFFHCEIRNRLTEITGCDERMRRTFLFCSNCRGMKQKSIELDSNPILSAIEIPSGIKMICSKSVSGNKSIKSVVIENIGCSISPYNLNGRALPTHLTHRSR
jgi:hypothetical protein